jgi:ATP-binding cassette subfamily B protein
MPERSLLATKILQASAQFRYLPRVLCLVWSAARRWSLLWAALLIFQGLLPVAVVLLTKELVDGLTGILGVPIEWNVLAPVVIPAALLGGLLMLAELLRGVSDWVRTVQAKLIEDHVSGLVQEKSTAVDLAFYESPDYFDHLHRARDESGTRPIALLENTGSVIQNGMTLIAMAAVLVPYGLWISVALVVSTLPALAVVLHFAVRHHQWRMQITADVRRTYYYDWLVTDRVPASELRLFGLGDYLRAAYQTLRARLRREELQLSRAQVLAEFAASVIALSISGVCLGWMAWLAIQGQATLGDLALFYQAFNIGQRLAHSLLNNVGQIYYNVLFLGNLFEFLDLQSRVRDPLQTDAHPPRVSESKPVAIRFNDVTFCYPDSERVALKGFQLEVPAGQIAAIVGTNGAGKSTLIKLLCRFYDPTTGFIEFDGIDVRKFSLSELRGLITILFQEPVRYNASVAENIAVGSAGNTAMRAEIEAAAQAAGADGMIARLPKGYDTPLGRLFAAGVDLSAGEWQRIALARAFFRKAPIIVLDEPTSAMDSWAEADWLQRFRALAAGRTAMIVTHRFTTAMRADVIHVMNNGRITESGSHGELLKQGGAYAHSWGMQMQAELNAHSL